MIASNDVSVNNITFTATILLSIFTALILVMDGNIFCVGLRLRRYSIMGFFEGENFHEFHKSKAIRKNFTLKIFPLQMC